MAKNRNEDDELEAEADASPETAQGDIPEEISDEDIPTSNDDDLAEPKAPEDPTDPEDIGGESEDADAVGEKSILGDDTAEDASSRMLDENGLDQESPDLSPFAKPSHQASQLSKFQQYMQDYKALQDQRRKGDLLDVMNQAGNKIGQSMAGRYSGNFTPDPAGNAALQKMNERPVQDFEQRQIIQSRGHQLESEAAATDPTSPQSKLVRQYVQSRLGLKLDDNVSAADAQMLLKTVGRPIQTKFQKVNGTWQDAEGKTHSGSAIFDPAQGTYINPDTRAPIPGFHAEGLNPFQMVTNPNTGEKEVFNKGSGAAPIPSSANQKPSLNSATTTQQVNAGLDPVTRKEMNDKVIPNFNKLTEKTQQRLMHQAPIMAKLEEAQLNPAAYAQLQAELARFDVGDQRLAQQEFNMFATRHGYKGWADWVQKNSTGTISPDFAQDFAHTINNTVKGMQQDLNDQAEKTANQVIGRMPPGTKVDPKLIAPLIYAGYKPVAEAKGKKVVRQGYNPQTNKTQLIYSDGTKEIVDGQR